MHKHERYFIKKVGINKTNIADAIQKIDNQIAMQKTAYICVLNSRALYYAIKHEEYCKIQNESFLTLPDGKPLAIIANLRGYKEVQKTSGPDLFREILNISKQRIYSHFFYGSTPGVISNMVTNIKKEFNSIDICAAISPPFGSAEDLVNDEIIEKINEANPTFLWLGLGAPKQEIVANMLKNKLRNTIIIGVGLVFEYEAGTVKRPPKWIQDLGFEWLYRVFQQFKRSKNFIVPFTFILSTIMLEILKNIKRRLP